MSSSTCICSLSVGCLHCFFFSSRRRHTRFDCDWSSDVCSSDLWRGKGRSPLRPRESQPQQPEQHSGCVHPQPQSPYSRGHCLRSRQTADLLVCRPFSAQTSAVAAPKPAQSRTSISKRKEKCVSSTLLGKLPESIYED